MDSRRTGALIIDPLSKTSRLNQVYQWVNGQIATKQPRKLSMRPVRTALPRKEREVLLNRINQQLGERYGFTCRWSGNRKGALYLRFEWKDK